MARGRVVDKDIGFKAIRAEIEKLKNKPYVAIGIQGKSAMEKKKDPDDGSTGTATVVDIGTFHEFGTTGAKGKVIPERSFIRSTRDENDQKYRKIIETMRQQIFKPRGTSVAMTVEQGLGLLGELIQGDIQAKFLNNNWEELQDQTRGGRNPEGDAKPLIDTGQLRQSIRYQVYMKGLGKK